MFSPVLDCKTDIKPQTIPSSLEKNNNHGEKSLKNCLHL